MINSVTITPSSRLCLHAFDQQKYKNFCEALIHKGSKELGSFFANSGQDEQESIKYVLEQQLESYDDISSLAVTAKTTIKVRLGDLKTKHCKGSHSLRSSLLTYVEAGLVESMTVQLADKNSTIQIYGKDIKPRFTTEEIFFDNFASFLRKDAFKLSSLIFKDVIDKAGIDQDSLAFELIMINTIEKCHSLTQDLLLSFSINIPFESANLIADNLKGNSNTFDERSYQVLPQFMDRRFYAEGLKKPTLTNNSIKDERVTIFAWAPPKRNQSIEQQLIGALTLKKYFTSPLSTSKSLEGIKKEWTESILEEAKEKFKSARVAYSYLTNCTKVTSLIELIQSNDIIKLHKSVEAGLIDNVTYTTYDPTFKQILFKAEDTNPDKDNFDKSIEHLICESTGLSPLQAIKMTEVKIEYRSPGILKPPHIRSLDTTMATFL
ncbi:hypothetical protein [Photobacterium kishitanii]|uniref:Uncharacterized protein n=1 Tax=Photobacterium kishitanii TaxID=318456 RepID=A0A2T3KM40_9GAMM|nr:hypothetical protein [Photobacterium kishitanii]PSV00710.1 hypothetical protein C9J27_06095 [Photobacterium kishitanii]